MSFPAPHLASVAQLGAALRRGTVSSVEITQHFLQRIAEHDATLHAFVTVTHERALADAARADRELQSGQARGPLHGVPYALKDIFDVAGVPTTCNSKLTLDRVPLHDSTLERRLREGGGVLLGKLATHELALGGPSPELPFPPARNPWRLEHFPGASSSGCGVGVAAGLVPVSYGSDTSGSVRGPAAHCGLVGLKPTYGLVSRRGVFPLSYSLDHCGPVTRYVEDSALALAAVAGHDSFDPSSVDRPVVDYREQLERGLRGLRVGFARHLLVEGEAAPEVAAAVEAAAQTLAQAGAEVIDVKLPDFALFNACGRVIMTAEAFAIHERELASRPHDFGRYTYQRVVPGVGLSAADLTQALRLRGELTAAVQQVLEQCDVVIAPNALFPAARFADFGRDWPPPRHASATQTIIFNVTGHPALAMPIGFTNQGLPLSMQLAARAFEEPLLFRVARAYEKLTGWTDRRPPEPFEVEARRTHVDQPHGL